jgi:uncharacterized protein YdcH (DUF465 family)
MIAIDSLLVELKSQRAQVEIQLLGLRKRKGADAEIERLGEELRVLDRRIERIERGARSDDLDEVSSASLQTSAELDQVRARILDTLRGLAEPLRLHAELAERQRRLSGRIRAVTGKDNSYQAYLDTALIRVSDLDRELESVLELLKRTRPVA